MQFVDHPYILLIVAIICIPVCYIILSFMLDLFSPSKAINYIFELDFKSILLNILSFRDYGSDVIRNIVITILVYFGIYILFVCSVTEIVCKIFF